MARSEIRGGQVKDDSLTGDDIDETTLIINTLKDADGDTKIQIEESADEDKIRFDTAGAERMIITNAGAVGIGTSAPDNTLHVKSPGTTHIKIESEAGHEAALKLKSGDEASAYVWQPGSTSDLRFYVNGADRVHVDNTGNVGIGTTNPAATLTVAGSLALNILNINAANDPGSTYTMVSTDCVILVNTRPTAQGGTDGAITLVLPDASDYPGRVVTVKDAAGYADTNAITIKRAGTDLINGIDVAVALPSPSSFKTFISDGASAWQEIGS